MALISVVGLSIGGNAAADVLVQPGYGQPQTPLLPQQIAQPFPTVPRVPGYGAFQQHSPGYHLELHPIYGHLGHSYGGLGHHHGHDLLPIHSKPLYRHLPYGDYGGLSGFGLPGTRGIVPPQIPLAANGRYRRSIGEPPSDGVQREKRESVAVATKPTLNGDNGMVVDFLNQDKEEKRVEVRQSKNDQAESDSTLLGLNPPSMYPAQNQYQFAMPASSSYQQIVNEEPAPPAQINTRAAIHEQATPQNQAAATTANTVRETRSGYASSMLPPQVLVLNQSPWRTAQVVVQDPKRNYPDPRPMTDAERIDHEKLKNHVESQQAKSPESSEKDEIVGSHHHHKIKTITHIHQHAKFRSNDYENEPYTPCTCQNPVYTVYSDATNNLPLTQLGVQEPGLALQLASLPETDSPNMGYYVVAPQTYSSPIVYSDYSYSAMPSVIAQDAKL
ncbi:uncharacterized protein LOC144473436 [Augochlora pura]